MAAAGEALVAGKVVAPVAGTAEAARAAEEQEAGPAVVAPVAEAEVAGMEEAPVAATAVEAKAAGEVVEATVAGATAGARTG